MGGLRVFLREKEKIVPQRASEVIPHVRWRTGMTMSRVTDIVQQWELSTAPPKLFFSNIFRVATKML